MFLITHFSTRSVLSFQVILHCRTVLSSQNVLFSRRRLRGLPTTAKLAHLSPHSSGFHFHPPHQKNLPNTKYKIINSTKPTAQAIVVVNDQVLTCSFVSVIPIRRFVTQKKLSLKVEKNSAPIQAARAPSTGLPPAAMTMGAQIPAEVVIATVPEPWAKRIKVAIRKGKTITGMGWLVICSARYAPMPVVVSILPSAPPPPVTRMIMPAAFRLSSIFSSASFLGILPARVYIAIIKPMPTAITGVPKKPNAAATAPCRSTAFEIVLHIIRMMGKKIGRKDKNVPGKPLSSSLTRSLYTGR